MIHNINQNSDYFNQIKDDDIVDKWLDSVAPEAFDLDEYWEDPNWCLGVILKRKFPEEESKPNIPHCTLIETNKVFLSVTLEIFEKQLSIKYAFTIESVRLVQLFVYQ